jgi:ribose transport system ATP-binding protein
VTAVAFRGIEKSFGAVRVLRGVDFEVARGEVHALLGENGAGKSTLMRILLGIERPSAGTMELGGRPYAPASPSEARMSGVAIVPQERTLCPDLTVLENIVLGIEPARFGVLQEEHAREVAARALALVTDRIPLDARVRTLPVADQQLIEIARALTFERASAIAGAGAEPGGTSRVLVLDEPTSSLGREDAARLFDVVRGLAERGIAVILVTHFLGDVKEHANRYTVLRDGAVVGSGDAKTTDGAVIVREMLGRELEAARERAAEEGEPGGSGDVVLEVEGLRGRDKPRSASFTLRRGEVLGIAGLVGSGRTELLRMIAGLDPAVAGRVTARGRVGLLSEDRGGEGLMLGRSIAENVTLSARGRWLSAPKRMFAEGARWITTLGIKAAGPAQAAGELSGGNQQKVQLARLVREDVDVLLIDEPTRGIDVAAKAQVMSLVRDLARKGKGVVLVSSQLDELVVNADRIAVLRRGELGEAAPASGTTEAQLLLEASS